MNEASRSPPHSRLEPVLAQAVAAFVMAALFSACSKAPEPLPPQPAVAIMPGTTPSADAGSPAPTLAATPPVNAASAGSGLPIVVGANPGGTLSVIPGSIPAPQSVPAPTVPPTPPPSLSAGVPPAPPASLPGAASIGPASAPANDQPLSVSPGTKQ